MKALRLTVLLLAGCQGAAGPEAIVAKASALSAASPKLRARLAAALPLHGLESHGAAELEAAPSRVLVARLPAHAAAPLAASDSRATRRALRLTLQNAAPVKAQPSGNWLVYGGALADTDLAMFAGDTLVEALFVMRSAAAPRQVDYRLELAAGLTARTSALGVELVDASGDVALRIPPSRAVDARGAEVPVRQWLEGDVLHLALQGTPEAWPLLLDPLVEIAVWQQLSAGDPLPRAVAAAAYDSARDRVVLFGGSSPANTNLGDTWEWDGASWQLMSSTGPAPATGGAMAYDPVRRVTVLYGGYGNGELTQTWEWDGSAWSLKSSTAPPGGAAQGAAMLWDGAGQRILMFGGTSIPYGRSSTTVTWDGTTWSTVVGSGPAPRTAPALAYDPGRNVVVLFGGIASTWMGDTWELSGSTWTQRFPSPPLPPARSGAAMVYSEPRGTVVMSGGAGDGGLPLGDLWEWNGAAWSPLPNPPFGALVAPNVVEDSKRHRALAMMGGFNTNTPIGLATTGRLSDVWAWDGGTWQNVTPHDNPSHRRAAAMAYDVSRDVATLFGGNNGSLQAPAQLQDTWEWDGLRWASRPGPQPSAMASPALAFDANRHVQVLSTNGGETWEWDGGTWQQRGASLSAPATALAYDSARGVTVAVVNGGVYEYAGSAWSPRGFSGAAPTNTSQFGLAADGHGRTWLFGGNVSSSSWSSQLWAWDGGSWSQASGPAALQRERAAWLWDTGHDVGVLYGGAKDAGPAAFEDTWLFAPADGGTWTLQSGTHPPGRISAAFAYDSRRGRGVLFGGGDNTLVQVLFPFPYLTTELYFNDTWALSWRRANGSDCADAGQCASGFCTDGVCCSTGPCASRCAACNVNGLGTCAAVDAGAVGAPSCAPYLCDGVSTDCPVSCSADAGCAGGSACLGGICAPSLPKGSDCVNDAQCLSGHCVGSICCVTACDGGCQTCRQSEGASEDGACGARPSSHTCRAAADQCDVAERCDGVSPDCPTDRFATQGVTCRGAVDTCDLPELCTGTSAQCPDNALQPQNTPCTSSLQTCAAPSHCDGLSPLCPASKPALASTPCRAIAGPCDRPEVCDGVRLDCPADELLPAGTLCNDQQCAAECNGTSVECSECPPVSRFAFGCAAAPAPALWFALLALLRKRRTMRRCFAA